jgi:pimeloyl-ACP methyl ester carboxylesterase
VLIGAALVLVGAACSGSAPPVAVERDPSTTATSTAADSAADSIAASTTEPASTTAPTTAPTTTIAGAPEPKIDWKPCGTELECGSLTVLLDHTDPSKGTIDLAVERRPARQRDARIGSLLVNPGGPGFPGTVAAEQASFYFSKQLLDRFDIVGWDPRGTGRSAPINCTDNLDPFLIGVDVTPDTPAEVQQVANVEAVFDTGCAARSGAVLPYVSTQDSARDMDSLRRALGEDTISYFGYSYGSELGATWVTMFPSTVRAAVLDGAVDPNAPWADDQLRQAVGAERGFTTLMEACAADPRCPFNNDGDPVGAYEALAAALEQRPLVVTRDRPPVNETVLMYAVLSVLPDDSLSQDLYRALADAQHGDGRGLLALYDGYVQRRADGTFSNVIEGYVAIGCLDYDGPTDQAAFSAIRKSINRAAPHLGVAYGYKAACTRWPAKASPPLELTAAGAGPILLVGTTGDAVTPIESTKALAESFEQGVLLTVEGFHHTGYGVNQCSSDVVDAYLIDGTLPGAGTVCR